MSGIRVLFVLALILATSCTPSHLPFPLKIELPIRAIGNVGITDARIVAFGWTGPEDDEIAGTLIAFDSASGKESWRRDVRARTLVEGLREPSPPAYASIAEGTVAFRDPDGRIVVLDAASGTDRWTGPAVASIASMAEGRVRAIDPDGRLLTFDIGTGVPLRLESLRSSPGAWKRDRVLVAAGREFIALGGPVVARDAVSGQPLWTATDGGTEVELVDTGEVLVVSETGRMIGIDATTGRTRWINKTALDVVVRPPWVAGGLLVTTRGERNGEAIHVLDSGTGKELRTIDAPVFVGGGSGIVLGASFRDHYGFLSKLFVELGDGVSWSDSMDWRVDGFDPATGNVVWTSKEWSWGYLGTPVFGDGLAVVPHLSVKQSAPARLLVYRIKQ